MKRSHRLLQYFFTFSAHLSCATIALLFCLMLYLGWPLLKSGQLFTMLVQHWRPSEGLYGIYPMLMGSFAISSLALLFGFPLSLGVAAVTTILAPPRVRVALLLLVRFMSGIPTVVYGFVAIFLLVPFMREYVTGGSGMSICTASLVLALLIAPTMIVFFVNGFSNIPKSYCAALDAMGATPVQKLLYLLLPQAWHCLISGAILGFGRALGDTLISLMLAGNSIATPHLVTDSARTLTAHIALVVAADVNSMEFKTIFVCGLILYIITTILVEAVRLLAAKVSSLQ